MKIGIFGGTFDPVHCGHVGLAVQAIERLNLDKVIFVPAKLQPFKVGQEIMYGEERIKMLKMAIDELAKDAPIEISDIELYREGLSYTIDTLNAFREIYPEAKIYFILGTDALLKINKWKSAEELLTKFSLAVGMRPGYKNEALDECIDEIRKVYNTDITKLNNEQIDISSTVLRTVSSGKELKDGVVPESVERYIEENGLYNRIH